MATGVMVPGPDVDRASSAQRKVIVASTLGTAFSWYDFNLFAALSPVIGQHFFPDADNNTDLVFALLAFSAGFIVRPLGAVIFGRLGDAIGRKFAFLISMLTMGLATFGVGVLPGYATIGLAAPILLIGLRLLQGLALGGEYGGAVIYVAEHAPPERRGAFTAWVQTTATLGLVLSLVVTLATRTALGEAPFAAWGWRIPFLLSVFLLAVSAWMRVSLQESPLFTKMAAEGELSKAPITQAFGQWSNLKRVLLALFGLVTGFGVIWYAAQVYVLLFLIQTLKVDGATATALVIVPLCLAVPLFILFGWLSDRIGRKWLIVSGLLLASMSLFPVFRALTHYANPQLEAALKAAPVVVIADPNDCQFQFNPTGTKRFTSSCDIAKQKLVAASVNFRTEPAPPGTLAQVKVGARVLASFDAAKLPPEEAQARDQQFTRDLDAAIRAAGYPTQADPAQINTGMVMLLVFVPVFCLTMAYGPVAAMLVELFPARIRYCSISLPYHIGTSWFGGLVPSIGFALVAYAGDIYSGLWFPVVVALSSVLIAALFLRDRTSVERSSRTPANG
jgi:MFS family permease